MGGKKSRRKRLDNQKDNQSLLPWNQNNKILLIPILSGTAFRKVKLEHMDQMYNLESYYYDLPESQIAQEPAVPRDSSRLLVLDRYSGSIIHKKFRDIIDLVRPGDLMVLNNTRVIPARIRGKKLGGTSNVELLLLSPVKENGTLWEALVRPGRRLKPGKRVRLSNGVEVSVEGYLADGTREVRFPDNTNVIELLHEIGEVPLPPYIHNESVDPDSYQTVFAERDGSSAAPTASLHFTEELLGQITAKGVSMAWVTLNVGLGTFRPVKEDDIRDHVIHKELCEVPAETSRLISETRAAGGRVIAVGTTVVRTLESLHNEILQQKGGQKYTGLFIYPGFPYKVVDCMITNFHLPRSTLLMLVAAFAGYDSTMRAYKEAVAEGYRFFSFGDAMFIG
jgi:S-adenosylmethionine:tRNA ribosyltransferase-isomerase